MLKKKNKSNLKLNFLLDRILELPLIVITVGVIIGINIIIFTTILKPSLAFLKSAVQKDYRVNR
jgi:hypothetical protein